MNPDLDRRLEHIHLTLELVAFLLAVLVMLQGSFGVLVGGAAVVLLALNAVNRWVDERVTDPTMD